MDAPAGNIHKGLYSSGKGWIHLHLLSARSAPFFLFLFPLVIVMHAHFIHQDVAKQLRDQQMVMKGHRDDALVHVSCAG